MNLLIRITWGSLQTSQISGHTPDQLNPDLRLGHVGVSTSCASWWASRRASGFGPARLWSRGGASPAAAAAAGDGVIRAVVPRLLGTMPRRAQRSRAGLGRRALPQPLTTSRCPCRTCRRPQWRDGAAGGGGVVLFGSSAKVTSVYLHGADAPSWGNLESGEKGPF